MGVVVVAACVQNDRPQGRAGYVAGTEYVAGVVADMPGRVRAEVRRFSRRRAEGVRQFMCRSRCAVASGAKIIGAASRCRNVEVDDGDGSSRVTACVPCRDAAAVGQRRTVVERQRLRRRRDTSRNVPKQRSRPVVATVVCARPREAYRPDVQHSEPGRTSGEREQVESRHPGGILPLPPRRDLLDVGRDRRRERHEPVGPVRGHRVHDPDLVGRRKLHVRLAVGRRLVVPTPGHGACRVGRRASGGPCGDGRGRAIERRTVVLGVRRGAHECAEQDQQDQPCGKRDAPTCESRPTGHPAVPRVATSAVHGIDALPF